MLARAGARRVGEGFAPIPPRQFEAHFGQLSERRRKRPFLFGHIEAMLRTLTPQSAAR